MFFAPAVNLSRVGEALHMGGEQGELERRKGDSVGIFNETFVDIFGDDMGDTPMSMEKSAQLNDCFGDG